MFLVRGKGPVAFAIVNACGVGREAGRINI